MKDILENNNIQIQVKRGIYFLFNKNILVYIGQSEFIEKRIFEHTGTKEFDSWNFIEFTCDISLNEIEADFIIKYQPKYNKNIPVNNLWISRSVLSRFHKIPMLKTRRLIKNNEVECLKFKNTEYIKWKF